MTRARVDDNQAVIVAALRQVGATVQILSAVGRGCPDLLIGFRSLNTLLEVKDAAKSASRRTLTPDERAWHEQWRGQVTTVTTVDEALIAIGAIV
jgi:hypothetical protein